MNGLVHNLLVQFFTVGSLSIKIEFSEPDFFDIVTTKNDHPIYVKHVFGSIYVFFTNFSIECRGGGGGFQGIGTQSANAIFHLGQLNNRSFRKFFFLIL